MTGNLEKKIILPSDKFMYENKENKFNYILFMKVGFHSDETFNEIITRKQEESQQGPFFWGYGGTICHPRNQVQPFAEIAKEQGQKVYLLMSLTPSKFKTKPEQSHQYSIDNKNWIDVPEYALITGSKYALVCSNIQKVEMEIDFNNYVVGIGPQKGKVLTDYIKFRVDKGCAKVASQVETTLDNKTIEKNVPVQYVAELVFPYSVFLSKNKRKQMPKQQKLF